MNIIQACAVVLGGLLIFTLLGFINLQWQIIRYKDRIDRLDRKLAEHLASDPRYKKVR